MDKQKKSPILSAMSPEHTEKFNAICVIRLARELAQRHSNPCDAEAAAVAVLVRAVELVTSHLSNEARVSLFLQFPAKSASNRIPQCWSKAPRVYLSAHSSTVSGD